MDKKLVITALYNEKKPIKYEQSLFKEKDGGMYMNFTESIITQMVKARNEDMFKAICERIQEFIEKEGIDICFAINQNELLDCLNEHQKLKLQIADLEAELAEYEEIKKKYKTIFLDRFVDAKVEDAKIWKEKYDQLKQQLAEKEKEIEELKKGVFKVTLGTNKSNQIDFTENFYIIQNQTAIAVLEEMLENEIYLNVIPDFECGDYVSSKIIKTKIEELKNGRN